jgi:hypothetical protein
MESRFMVGLQRLRQQGTNSDPLCAAALWRKRDRHVSIDARSEHNSLKSPVLEIAGRLTR